MMGKIQNGRHKSQKMIYLVISRRVVVLEYIIACLIICYISFFDIHLIIKIQNSTWSTKYKMATDEIIGNGRRVYMPMKLLKNYISRTNFKYFFQNKAVQD